MIYKIINLKFVQCSIPVFEGLLPEPHNSNVLSVLFILAHWHALAKLRQHTDLSLAILDAVTSQLGESLRNFQATTCAAYDTRELIRKKSARVRQTTNNPTVNDKIPENRADVTESATSSQISVAQNMPEVTCITSLNTIQATTKPTNSTSRLHKTLNLNTYKDHALGDYVETIRRYGTVDSYSTEAVSYVSLFTCSCQNLFSES